MLLVVHAARRLRSDDPVKLKPHHHAVVRSGGLLLIFEATQVHFFVVVLESHVPLLVATVPAHSPELGGVRALLQRNLARNSAPIATAAAAAAFLAVHPAPAPVAAAAASAAPA
jgi:hypothetical protein